MNRKTRQSSTERLNDAWIYCAVSSGAQETTLEDQLAWGRRCASENGWTVTREFDGVGSGKMGVRKVLERLLIDLRNTPKAERPARVLMIRLDRIGRGDPLETAGAFAEIRKLGVTIHTRDDGDNTVDNALDAIKPILKLITGSLENEARRDKSLAAHAKRKAQGKSWRAPFGLKRTDDDYLEPQEPEASIVREVFTLRSQGWGCEAIGKRMMAVEQSRSWSRSFVFSLLHRSTYRGVLIDEAMFDSVQKLDGKQYMTRAQQRFPWPLAGAIRCECGHLLHGIASGRDRWRIRYYVCDNRRLHGMRRAFRADDVEAQFLERLHELQASPELVDAYRSRPAQARTGLNERLRKLEAERKELDKQRQFVWRMKAYTSEFEVAEQLKVLRADEERLSGAINDTKREIAGSAAAETILKDASALIGRIANTWPTLPVEDQQRAARALASAFKILVVDTDPERIRGPKAKRFSAKGRVEFCVQDSENTWTEVSTKLSAWAGS